ncbi:MAG: tetratricopeptide repeat protein [Acidobacteria bacterium]|nr:MAG: tetratricopeptide repeat protein [Acidobacteriota bacterium]
MNARFTAVLSIAALLAALPAAAEVSLNERWTGINVAVMDREGNPIDGVPVLLQESGSAAAPLELKTRKGIARFPRVEFVPDGYTLRIGDDRYFIWKFHIRTRRGSREIWQDDEGVLTPDNQDALPPVRFHVGNASVWLTLVPRDQAAEVLGAPKPKPAEAEPARRAARRPRTPLERADEALALRDYAAAAAALGEALEADPENVDLRWRRAQVLARAGDRGTALREANKVLAQDPQRAGVRLQMAEWLVDDGKLDQAVPLLEKEREISPGDVSVIKLLVSAYREVGRTEDAEKAVEQWAELAPDDPEALISLAELRATQGRFEEAERLYAQVAEKDPENAHRMYYNVGASILNGRNVGEAERRRAAAAFRKALELKPDYAKAHLQLGYALLGLGEMAEARQHFEKFVELAPDDPQAEEVKGLIQALR